jgi:hypothetical protein
MNLYILNSYSNCNIVDVLSGGIIGGYNNTMYDLMASYNDVNSLPYCLISNCYYSGQIYDLSYGIMPQNMYNLNTYFKQPPMNATFIDISNCYVTNSWNDISANLFLKNTPLNIYNQGFVWTKINNNLPYVLSSYNSTIYDPSYEYINGIYNNKITKQGLFQSDYNYKIISILYGLESYNTNNIYIDSSNGIITFNGNINDSLNGLYHKVNVFVSKYKNNIPYDYNINFYTLYYNNLQILSNILLPICLTGDTIIKTDQGYKKIENVDINVDTIESKKIKVVTKTLSFEKYIICIEKDALSKNIPNKNTYITKDHNILYKDKMIPAKELIGKIERVYEIKYENQILYNILMDNIYTYKANNITVETLDPNGIFAKLYTKNYSSDELDKILYFILCLIVVEIYN